MNETASCGVALFHGASNRMTAIMNGFKGRGSIASVSLEGLCRVEGLITRHRGENRHSYPRTYFNIVIVPNPCTGQKERGRIRRDCCLSMRDS
jgi:hypothetical protein